MKKSHYRKLPRTLSVEPPKPGTKRARAMSRSVARVPVAIQRYSYQIALRRLAINIRKMSSRLRRAETQLSRGYRTLVGTKEEMENSENIGGGLLWWATDESVLYVHDDTGWHLSKATHAGTTTERYIYSPIFTGELWWDTTLEQLFVWNGSAWDDVAVSHSGTNAERLAYSPDTGDLWLDTTEREWYSDIGNGWQVICPSLMDTFSRLPGLMNLASSGVWWGNTSGFYMEESMWGSNLVFCTWTKPKQASSSSPTWGPIIHQRNTWNPETEGFGFSLEQNGTAFAFGISTDGIRNNWIHIDTPGITGANNTWHFLAGIYDPGVSLKLFHNGVWYEYGGTVPSSRYLGLLSANLTSTYAEVSILVASPTIPSDAIIDCVYRRTRGLFL